MAKMSEAKPNVLTAPRRESVAATLERWGILPRVRAMSLARLMILPAALLAGGAVGMALVDVPDREAELAREIEGLDRSIAATAAGGDGFITLGQLPEKLALARDSDARERVLGAPASDNARPDDVPTIEDLFDRWGLAPPPAPPDGRVRVWTREAQDPDGAAVLVHLISGRYEGGASYMGIVERFEPDGTIRIAQMSSAWGEGGDPKRREELESAVIYALICGGLWAFAWLADLPNIALREIRPERAPARKPVDQ